MQILRFEPHPNVKVDISARGKYPINESTLNGANFTEAASKLAGGDHNYHTKMFWDVRTPENPHPDNK